MKKMSARKIATARNRQLTTAKRTKLTARKRPSFETPVMDMEIIISGKRGLKTLQALAKKHGPLPPTFSLRDNDVITFVYSTPLQFLPGFSSVDEMLGAFTMVRAEDLGDGVKATLGGATFRKLRVRDPMETSMSDLAHWPQIPPQWFHMVMQIAGEASVSEAEVSEVEN